MMPQLDMAKWAVFAPKDFTGLGRQADMAKLALGIRRHIVYPSTRLEGLDVIPPDEVILRPDEPVEALEAALSGLQGVVFFERCEWHPALVKTAKRLGVRTVCVINWEWFKRGPNWDDVDLLACPSKWTLEIVRSCGYARATRLVWPIDLPRLPKRTIIGPGKLFIHNAGLVDQQDRKGTRDTIRAFVRTRRPDIRLIVRMQKSAPLPTLDGRVNVVVGNLDDPSDLYREGDVAIQPSKMEGIGFMVVEPWSCGIPVITTNYPPMNEFVTDPNLLVKLRWGKRRAFATTWIPNAHLRLPQTGDLVRKIEWCADNDLTEISRASRAEAERMFVAEVVHAAWMEALSGVLDGK